MKNMALNGSEFMVDPWGTIFSCFTDFFYDIVGNGQVFYLFPLVILTIGLQIKSQSSVMTSMFMIASGALLGSAGIFTGATSIAIAFLIFSALGFVGLFLSFIFQR